MWYAVNATYGRGISYLSRDIDNLAGVFGVVMAL